MRYCNVPNSYPLEPFKTECGGEEPGLVTLVERALDEDPPVMTIDQVQRLGTIDPVEVEVDDVPWLSLDNNDDGPKMLDIAQQLRVSQCLHTRIK